jgi:hypothetical protein
LRGHIPARLIDAVHPTTSGGISQSVPSRFSASRHAIHGPANGAAVHLELKAILQHRGHIGMGHPQALIHLDRQRQRVGPQLHRRRSQGIGGLLRIASLHSFVAHLATADGNIEAPPERLAHDFLLVLRLDPLHFQGAPAATLRWWGYGDDLVDFLGNRFAVPLAVGRAWLAPRGLGILFPRAPRKRCRLSFTRALRFFQLSLQLFVFFPQLLSFLLPLFLSLP